MRAICKPWFCSCAYWWEAVPLHGHCKSNGCDRTTSRHRTDTHQFAAAHLDHSNVCHWVEGYTEQISCRQNKRMPWCTTSTHDGKAATKWKKKKNFDFVSNSFLFVHYRRICSMRVIQFAFKRMYGFSAIAIISSMYRQWAHCIKIFLHFLSFGSYCGGRPNAPGKL